MSNIMTDDEIIQVVQDSKAGKVIQFKGGISNEWNGVIGSPLWAFNTTQYRTKPEVKKINLHYAIKYNLDCEFWDDDSQFKEIGKLNEFNLNNRHIYNYVDSLLTDWKQCRIRQDHWVYNELKGERILPDGLIVEVVNKLKYGAIVSAENVMNVHLKTSKDLDWSNIERFKVVGRDNGYE